MSVRLISISNPLTTGINNAEELISYCARVSNPSNQLNVETAPKLLKYLIKHKHWSPFEMVSMTVEIQTSRAIAAQILRHRSFSFQEFSQRYSVATELEAIELRRQGMTNRQVGDEPVDIGTYMELKEEIDHIQHQCVNIYNKLIAKGIAKECARMILPLNTQTTLYMAGTIRSWIHYIDLRATQDTQKEHRNIAQQIKKLFIQKFPIVSEALEYTDANVSTIS
jgi:thymidylate synthase (FAD)